MEINSDQFKKARSKREISQEDLAQILHVSQPLVMKWEKGQVKTFSSIAQVFEIAAALGANPADLVQGEDVQYIKLIGKLGKINYVSLPVLAFSDILAYVENNITPIHARSIEMINNSLQFSQKSFAVLIEGDAMISHENPSISYFPGEVAAVDPERTLSSGDVVLAHIPESGVKIRQYIKDGSEALLKPYNGSYDKISIKDDIKIIGVVVATQKVRKNG
jgi:transcriptional regulator with XRE-family HTH domain